MARSVPADRWRPTVGAGLVLALLATTGCARGSHQTGERPPSSVGTTLAALQRAVTEHDPEAAAALATPGDGPAAAQLALLAENAATVDLTHVSFRAGGSLAPEGAGTARQWSQQVATTWRIRGFDAAPARAGIRVDFTLSGERVTISGIGGSPGPTPLWVSTRLRAWRAPGVLLLTPAEHVGVGSDTLRDAVRAAVPTVAGATPGWDRRLVVEVAPTEAAFAAAVGGTPEQYAALAALTATSDASGTVPAPEHVFVNLDRFDALRTRAAGIVVAHEATHVALRAAASAMPLWLAEGWADHVALRGRPDAQRDVQRRLGRWTSRWGLPGSLPSDQAFSASGAALEHAYESSWAACAALTSLVGEQRALRLYRTVSAGVGVDEALHEVGLTREDLVREWWLRLSGSAR